MMTFDTPSVLARRAAPVTVRSAPIASNAMAVAARIARSDVARLERSRPKMADPHVMVVERHE
jgi:hypothetical protein